MLENVQVLCHSSILIKKQKTIYIDPFKIKVNRNDADIIFITHDHYDHYSEEDITKVRKENSIIVAPVNLAEKLCKGFSHVRVDLYNVNGKIYFGEMTFTNASGFEKITPNDYNLMLGKLWKLPNETRN